MRVALAAVLFAEPDLLLLDEPTNYLDLEGTLWLYDYLARYPHTVLIVSHDRDLLDTAVDHILHLDRGKLTLYRGGYTNFARQLAERQALQSKMRVKQEAERRHLQAFVDRFKAKASKARQAQSRIKRLAKLEPIAAVVEDRTLGFDLPSPERPLSPPIVAMEAVAAGYDGRAVLNRLNLTLLPDDRIALLGANGNGKSTFCKLVGGRLPPLAGRDETPAEARAGLFRPAPARRAEGERDALSSRRRAHARRAGGERSGPAAAGSAFPAPRPTRRSRRCPAARRRACSWGLPPSAGRISSSSTSRRTTSISTAAPP